MCRRRNHSAASHASIRAWRLESYHQRAIEDSSSKFGSDDRNSACREPHVHLLSLRVECFLVSRSIDVVSRWLLILVPPSFNLTQLRNKSFSRRHLRLVPD